VGPGNLADGGQDEPGHVLDTAEPPAPARANQPIDLITVKAAAELLGRTDRTVRRWINDSALQGHMVDGQWMVSEADVSALVQDTSDRTSDPEPVTAMVPIEALGVLMAELANASRDRARDAERAGRAEERERFQTDRRRETEAELERIRQELRDAVRQRDVAEAEATMLRSAPVVTAGPPRPERRRRWRRRDG